jgi:hypothetical protein
MKPPETATRRAAPREPERRPVVASPRTTFVAQTKAAAHMRPPPAAPPAYRPQPLPKVLQPKTAAPQRPFVQPRAGIHAPVPHAPNAPRRMPEVMQAKTAPARPHAAVAHKRQPVAPPVFNAAPRNALQPKSYAGHTQTLNVPPSPNRAPFKVAPGRAVFTPVHARGPQAPPPPPSAFRVNVVQRAAEKKFSFGASDAEMSNQQWFKSGMSTFSSVLVENDDEELELLKVTKNLKTKTYGAEHAEDVAMRNLLGQFSAAELKGKLVILNLSKSPCSSGFGTSGDKKPGCTENLAEFVKETGVNLVITCRGFYKGLEKSKEAVEWLRGKGVDISVDVRTGAQARFGE